MIWEQNICQVNETNQIQSRYQDNHTNGQGNLNVLDDGNSNEDNCQGQK